MQQNNPVTETVESLDPNIIREFNELFTQSSPYRSILILVVSIFAAYWLSKFIADIIIRIAQAVATRSDNEKDELKAYKLRQVETYLSVTIALIRVVIVLIVAFVVWRTLSPEGSRQISGSGAAAIGASAIFIVIAGQTLGSILRDVTAGSVMIIEQWFKVGDYVKVESFWNVTGVVERLTLRSTKLRSLSGEVVWIHNQKIDAVHVTPNGVRTMAVDVLVKDKEAGQKLVKDCIAKLPTGTLLLVEKPKIYDTVQWANDLWVVTMQGKTVPGREWIIENYFLTMLQKENDKLPKKDRVLVGDPISRFADPVTEKRFRHAVRVQRKSGD